MKLCRFELLEAEGIARSGIFHESKVYETNGEKAIGIHDLSKVKFLPPVSKPPTIRAFREDGTYEYLSNATLLGPLHSYTMPPSIGEMEIEARVAAVVKDRGESVGPEEAHGFLLGFTNCIRFKHTVDGLPQDLGLAIGPFLHTLEDFKEYDEGAQAPISWRWELIVDKKQRYANEEAGALEPLKAIELASRTNAIQSGDLLLLPPLSHPPLLETSLERNVLPGDEVAIGFERLGFLLVHVE
jgi:hypothetical protein